MSLSAGAGGLRLFNPTDAAATAAITCDGAAVTRTVAPHALDDVLGGACTATAAGPLLVLETGTDADGTEWQRLAGPTAGDCPASVPVLLPSSGCRFGTAVVAVDAVPGASYSWSIDGGAVLAGAGSERVTVALGGGDVLHVSVAVATPGCTRSGAGVMALHDSFQIAKIDTGAGYLGQSRTMTWSYANGAPTSQTLTGDFGTVTLASDARSYSYVPLTEGDKSVTLLARSGPAPAEGRRRAAGRGTGAASDCNLARATATYHVDCARPDAVIIAPASTNIDTPFTARVDIPSYAAAKWTIVNGTPTAATGDSVVVRANGSAPVDLSVTVNAGSCANTSNKRVTVDSGPCDNPTVDVAVLRNDCSGTVVEARFNGKPPFSGTWNDGQTFTTSDRAADRGVYAPGTFSVTSFRDATCAGPASNSVTVAPRVVKATLTTPSGACANGGTVVATFAGTPPFTGTWSDGVAFTTSASQISRPLTKGGALWLEFHDAACAATETSNTLSVYDGTVTVSLDKYSAPTCAWNTTIDADIAGGVPPYTITWLDGVTQTTGGPPATRLTRSFSMNPPSGTFGVVAAHDSVCSLKVTPPITVTTRPQAYFYFTGLSCAGSTTTATLSTDPGPQASVVWTVDNGAIVGGQGTRNLKFTGTPGANVVIVCKISTSAGCTDAQSKNIQWPSTCP